EYEASYPLTTLRYRDALLPVRVGVTAFSPFMPGKTRDSATPGFHMVFTLENTSRETVRASLLAVLDNPIVSNLENRQLKNTLRREGGSSSLLLETDAQPDEKSDLGSLCLSVAGGEHSWITGTFRQFALPGLEEWSSQRVKAMRLDLLQDFFKSGRLPNTEASRDPSQDFKLTAAEIDALPADQLKNYCRQLSADALLNRVMAEARAADPAGADNEARMKTLLKEIAANLSGGLAGAGRLRSTWGTGALASEVVLVPGQRAEVRFTLGWFFPHHAPGGREIGHRYANWFQDAGEVNKFLLTNYPAHRAATESFARALADTSLGGPLAFVWSSQLGTLVKNTWWSNDGHYAIWEGLGCCGQSTTDVDFDGSSSIVALFPELKLGQMRHMAAFQNELGQVPHNYSNSFDRVDIPGFRRVDMNPQWVMMVCRDYLWTGDTDYLAALWPSVVKAMQYTASLDTNDDGLPDKDCSFQTYDQWGLRGTPSYIASLWIGALRAAIRLARDLPATENLGGKWQALLDKASASFDRLLFNGEYYSLWVDGDLRDEICMSDQISGEWFSHLMGLPSTISEKNLARAVDSVWKYNFSPETGLRNATAPKGGLDGPAINNLQAGGVWSGIEFAFASFLMDHGRFADGVRLAEAVHRRYLRAGMPWTHVECGSHYTRAMSSWATLLAATGFKPDWPAQTLALLPAAPGDFHAPWVTAAGFGRLSRRSGVLGIDCVSGALKFKKLQVNLAKSNLKVRLSGKTIAATATRAGSLTTLEFPQPLTINAGDSLTIG
ncbi:MAG: GH116 family glycosyl hydrolase, partial [Verrucomicrobiota bacterium]